MIYIVHGQNGLATEERVARLRFELDPDGFSTSVIELHHASMQDIRSALFAAPFFGGQRLVILRGPIQIGKQSANTEASDDEEQDIVPPPDTSGRKPEWRDLSTQLATVPVTTTVICWISGTLPSNHAFAKAARDAGWTVEAHRIPRGAELAAWVSASAQTLGAQITPDAVETLLDLLYPTMWRSEGRWETATIDMRLIASEVEKLACAADSGRIDRGLVEELVADRGGYAAFKLSDQIFSGQTNAALVELDAVLGAGEAAEKIIAQLSSDVAIRWTARSTADLPVDQVAAALKTSPGRVTTSRGKSAGIDQANLAAAAVSLRDSEYAVKTGHSRDTTATIVPLVAGIATHFSRRRGGH